LYDKDNIGAQKYEELTKEICSSNETVSADKIIDTVINDNKLQGV